MISTIKTTRQVLLLKNVENYAYFPVYGYKLQGSGYREIQMG